MLHGNGRRFAMKTEPAMPIFFLDVIVFFTLIVLAGKRTCTSFGGRCRFTFP